MNYSAARVTTEAMKNPIFFVYAKIPMSCTMERTAAIIIRAVFFFPQPNVIADDFSNRGAGTNLGNFILGDQLLTLTLGGTIDSPRIYGVFLDGSADCRPSVHGNFRSAAPALVVIGFFHRRFSYWLRHKNSFQIVRLFLCRNTCKPTLPIDRLTFGHPCVVTVS